MLFEKLTYQDDFPINITIASVEEYPLHYHKDIEFVYVLKGEIKLKNGYCQYTLKEGDIFTNAGHEVHSLLATDEENIVALIQISTHYFSQYFPSLSKSCYRTYSNKQTTKRHDSLREKLLQILLAYEIRSFNYKSECIYLIVDIIKYLEKYFNLFVFENNMVINYDSGDQMTTERISRIITYIYQYYAEKITLEDLAKMEHLSEFYISHMIKDCTGKNFRDFLCFARVEWSEIELLDTNKKISQIARDVGFSTTAYYKKYFYKWFGRTPEEHRAYYKPMVKSELRPDIIHPVTSNAIIYMLKDALSALNSQQTSLSVVNSLKLEVDADRKAKAIMSIDFKLHVAICLDDFRSLGFGLFHALELLSPASVILMGHPGDAPEEIKKLRGMLISAGFSVLEREAPAAGSFESFGNDTIAAAIYIIAMQLKKNGQGLMLRLRDTASCDLPGEGNLLKGQPSLLTSCGIKKSSFYVYQALSRLRGDVISRGRHFLIIRLRDTQEEAFAAVVYNYNDSILSLCTEVSSVHHARTVLNDFKDEIDLALSLNLAPGNYSVMKYSMDRSTDVFAYLTSLNFEENPGFDDLLKNMIPTAPQLVIYQEDVRTNFHMNFSIKGAGVELAIIRPISK